MDVIVFLFNSWPNLPDSFMMQAIRIGMVLLIATVTIKAGVFAMFGKSVIKYPFLTALFANLASALVGYMLMRFVAGPAPVSLAHDADRFYRVLRWFTAPWASFWGMWAFLAFNYVLSVLSEAMILLLMNRRQARLGSALRLSLIANLVTYLVLLLAVLSRDGIKHVMLVHPDYRTPPYSVFGKDWLMWLFETLSSLIYSSRFTVAGLFALIFICRKFRDTPATLRVLAGIVGFLTGLLNWGINLQFMLDSRIWIVILIPRGMIGAMVALVIAEAYRIIYVKRRARPKPETLE